MASENTLNRKPVYTRHRKETDGTAISADGTNLVTLLTARVRNALNAEGYESVSGFVLLTGGTNITLQPLEVVYYDEDGVAKQKFIPHTGGDIGPLTDGNSFNLSTPGGGMWFFRITAVTGSITSGQVYVSAGSRAEEGSI